MGAAFKFREHGLAVPAEFLGEAFAGGVVAVDGEVLEGFEEGVLCVVELLEEGGLLRGAEVLEALEGVAEGLPAGRLRGEGVIDEERNAGVGGSGGIRARDDDVGE